MTEKKWVYLFTEIKEVEKYVNGEWEGVRSLLGGKGANLAEMAAFIRGRKLVSHLAVI